MLGRPPRLETVASIIFRAACGLTRSGFVVFDETQLIVEAWKLAPKRLGLPGYCDAHPDSKRIYVGLIHKCGPIRGGLIERAKECSYRLTMLGLDRMAASERMVG